MTIRMERFIHFHLGLGSKVPSKDFCLIRNWDFRDERKVHQNGGSMCVSLCLGNGTDPTNPNLVMGLIVFFLRHSPSPRFSRSEIQNSIRLIPPNLHFPIQITPHPPSPSYPRKLIYFGLSNVFQNDRLEMTGKLFPSLDNELSRFEYPLFSNRDPSVCS